MISDRSDVTRHFIYFPGVWCSENEFRLVRHLLDKNRYDPNVRPVLNYSDPVVVRIGMALNQIIDLVRVFPMKEKPHDS